MPKPKSDPTARAEAFEAKLKAALECAQRAEERFFKKVSAKTVQQWFREAATRFKPPDLGVCRDVVLPLGVICGEIAEGIPRRQPLTPDSRAAKRILSILQRMRERIKREISLASNPAFIERRKAFLADVETAIRVINEAVPVKPVLAEDSIRVIDRLAQHAWAKANRGRAPRSTHPDGPRVKFVVSALAESRGNISALEIGNILKGRRRSPQGAHFFCAKKRPFGRGEPP